MSGIHRQRPFFLYTDSRYLCLEVGEFLEIDYGCTADWTLCALADVHKSFPRCNDSDNYLPILLQRSKYKQLAVVHRAIPILATPVSFAQRPHSAVAQFIFPAFTVRSTTK